MMKPPTPSTPSPTRTAAIGLPFWGCLLFAISSMVTQVAAQQQFGDFTYQVVGNEVEIIGFTNDTPGHVEIPSHIEGKPVTTISEAFSFNGLTSVTIPDTVTTLGDSAFAAARSLHTVNMPDSVTSLGEACFYFCSSLQTIRLSTNLQTIGDAAFLFNTSLPAIDIPSSVTSIGFRAFHEASNLGTVTLREGLQSLGDWSFRACESLGSVSVPNSVTNFGRLAFADCVSLTNITLGTGVTVLDDFKFNNCENLVSVVVPEGVTEIGSLVGSCVRLESVTLPDSLTRFGDSAFYNCEALTTLELPSGLTSIGDRFLSQAGALKTLTIPATVHTVGNQPFYFSTNLSSVIFLGDAPANFLTRDPVGSDFAPDFSMYFIEGGTGFTAPLWKNYPMTMIQAEQSLTGPWLLRHGFAPTTNLGLDHNMDGNALLVSYALGLNPHQIDPSLLPQWGMHADGLDVSFFGGNPDVNYTVERSLDLVNWSTTDVTMTPKNAAGIQVGTLNTAEATAFIRLNFEIVPLP